MVFQSIETSSQGSAPDARALLHEPVDIASVAKGFTAMAVMMLAEQGKLRYDDAVGRHLPALAHAAPAIARCATC